MYKGRKAKTIGGLKKTDLTKNKAGKIVSKKRSALGKKNRKIARWGAATKAARKARGINDFPAFGGKTAKGQAVLKKVRSLYKK